MPVHECVVGKKERYKIQDTHTHTHTHMCVCADREREREREREFVYKSMDVFFS